MRIGQRAGLARHAGRFVWLSIDTENEKNAGFLERYPWAAVPTSVWTRIPAPVAICCTVSPRVDVANARSFLAMHAAR